MNENSKNYTLFLYKEFNGYYVGKLISDYKKKYRDSQCYFMRDNYEFETVIEFVRGFGNDTEHGGINNEKDLYSESLDNIRDTVLAYQKQVSVYIFEDYTWFSGIFNDFSIDRRKEFAKDEIHFKKPSADFWGYKISSRSSFARNNELPKIFQTAKKIESQFFETIIKNAITIKEDWEGYGNSLKNKSLKSICAYFNRNSGLDEIASYFSIWRWDKEIGVFISFDPEVPSTGDIFNKSSCLVYDDFVFEFYQPTIYGEDWEVFEAIVGQDYFHTTGTGEQYDTAYYSVLAFSKFVDFIKFKSNLFNLKIEEIQ